METDELTPFPSGLPTGSAWHMPWIVFLSLLLPLYHGGRLKKRSFFSLAFAATCKYNRKE
ncbi:hypothetical protein [Clostridium sp. Marseille-P2415]|uniref:hypothetical protein n=1 Tax=Clostridium sp. Marseille-P2415 TaxID=1805471 RepID=UPI000988402A|nr:hypothetical protein [Clostridium sp. Marseille-P2415]